LNYLKIESFPFPQANAGLLGVQHQSAKKSCQPVTAHVFLLPDSKKFKGNYKKRLFYFSVLK